MEGLVSADLKRRLTERALEEGFSKVGITRPDSVASAAKELADFLAKGRHGQMGWLADRATLRGDPTALWPAARSVVMLAEVYTPIHDPLDILQHRERAAVSVYAQNRDYHDLVKKRLKRIGRWLLQERPNDEIKAFVDTAPVMEKPLAQAAGLGWQGKHTNLLARDLGNWFFLGSIFTTVELDPDPPETERCGTCTACLDICPTNAFPAPFQLDARRCISYLTIEHSGPVAEDLRPALGNRIFGCDDCLAVCPWNKFAVAAREQRYMARADMIAPNLEELAKLNDTEFRKRFSGSPIKRTGRDRFVRNVLYAIGNSGFRMLEATASTLLDDPDPAVADAARWAVARLGPGP